MQIVKGTESYLKIANWRGRKPVLNSIKKAKENLRRLWVELAASDGFNKLKEVDILLNEIITENENL